MILIIISQIIVIGSLITMYKYKSILFTNLFNLVSVAIVLAFIPNFITSLLISTNNINNVEAQVEFGVTGAIATIFLWYVLKNIPTN